MKIRAPQHRARRHGFTLFEMVVVVGIFVLLAGGVYSVVSAAVRASAVLADENLQSQRRNAFVNLLRRTFHNLPATAQITGGIRMLDGKGAPEIVLRDAPGVFAWGYGSPSAGTIMLSAVPRLGGGMQFSLLTLPSSLSEAELRNAVEKGKWLRLMPDLREVRWRFYDQVQMEWLDAWEEGRGRPPLVELTFTELGEEVPRTYMFWIPPVKEYQPPAQPAEGAPSPTPPEPQPPTP
jgi:prepilin-type N-terminal cleavage/methylation domain-containing protein